MIGTGILGIFFWFVCISHCISGAASGVKADKLRGGIWVASF